jgi:DNA-binding NtrC family response regulator
MATILLLGLERSLADELGRSLIQLEHRVQTATLNKRTLVTTLATTDAELVFAPSNQLGIILRTRPDLPVVVASRLPEVSAWLDALQEGAADYCGAPFDAAQVGWVLNSTLGAVRSQPMSSQPTTTRTA